MDKSFIEEKQKFIENYNLVRPMMTIIGDEVRQEILLVLFESGGLVEFALEKYKKEVMFPVPQCHIT